MTGKEALIILSKCCSALAFEEGKWKINKRDNEALQTLKEIVQKYDKYKMAFEILEDRMILEIRGCSIEACHRCIILNQEEKELLEELMKSE